MLGSANIEVNILPILIGLLGNELFVVVRVHVAQIVSRTASKARHGAQLKGEDVRSIDETLVDDFLLGFVPGPFGGPPEWWLARFSWLVFVNLWEFERQAFLGNHVGQVILIVNWERFAPIALP